MALEGPLVDLPLSRRAGSSGTRTSCGRRSWPAASVVPQRGQRRPRLRSGMKSPVCTPPLRIADARGRPQDAAQVVELLDGQLARRAARGDPGLPERLVGEQVADPRDRALVEQPRLHRHRARARPARGSGPATSAASGPTCAKSGLDDARPSRRLSRNASRPPSAKLERRSGPSCSRPRARRPRSGRPCPGAARDRARRRRSRPTGTSRAGSPSSACGRRGRRRSRPGRAGGRRRCRGRRRRRSRARARARSAGGRVRPRGVRACL